MGCLWPTNWSVTQWGTLVCAEHSTSLRHMFLVISNFHVAFGYYSWAACDPLIDQLHNGAHWCAPNIPHHYVICSWSSVTSRLLLVITHGLLVTHWLISYTLRHTGCFWLLQGVVRLISHNKHIPVTPIEQVVYQRMMENYIQFNSLYINT